MGGPIMEPAKNPITGEISGVLERRIEAANQMFDIDMSNSRLTFLNPILAQTSLPYSEPAPNLPFYKCENGNVATTLIRGTLRNPYTKQFELQGYPFGTKPRLMLMYLCTEVTLKKKKEIYLGDSLSDFQMRLGIDYCSGGARGSLRPTKEQLMRLAASHLQLYCSDEKKHSMLHAAPPIRRFDFWLPDRIHEANKWEGMVTIDEDVFQCLREGNLPLRTEAIMALQNSPMALDVYAWLAFRLWRIRVSPMKPIPWVTLQCQFGPGYARTRDFKRDFKKILASVLKVYPEANVLFNGNDELVLMRSPAPVPRRLFIDVVKTIEFKCK